MNQVGSARVEDVAVEVGHRLGVLPGDIFHHRRWAEVVRARHWTWWLLVHRHGWSRRALALAIGRDCSSVWYGVDRIDAAIRRGQVPDELADLVDR